MRLPRLRSRPGPPTPASIPPAPRLPGDLDALARLVEGVDRARYLDVQAEEAWREAARRWPVLAAALGLAQEAAPPPARDPCDPCDPLDPRD